MAYLKPPWFTVRIFNRIAMAFGIGGSQTLTVTKRGSKQPQQIPVVVPVVDGVKYLVSTRGESEWVRNVRADPNVELGGKKFVAAEGFGVSVLQAGTSSDGDELVTTGGRVLAVTATGDSLADARELAYQGVAAISFDGAQYRRDIAEAAATSASLD